jgi:hypothetical protein
MCRYRGGCAASCHERKRDALMAHIEIQSLPRTPGISYGSVLESALRRVSSLRISGGDALRYLRPKSRRP